jgi:tetratricopeptide (TPR) repeat protein
MKGSLTEGLLPEVLRQLYVGRRTGYLHFTRQGERRSIYFRAGHIVHGDTNVKEERLGETLVQQGALSGADLKRATGFVLRDKKRLGAVLVELGILDRDRLEDALAIHVEEILRKVFSWSEGDYEFEEKEDAGLEPGMSLRLSTGEMILEAVRSVDDPDVIRFALGNLDRILGLSSDPLLRVQKIALTPADGYVLSRIDGTTSARELISVIPMVPDDTLRSLFGLVSTGVVEFLALPPKAQPKPDARPVGQPAPPRPRTPAPPPPPAEPAPAAPAPPAADVDPVEAKKREERRQQVLEAFDGLKTKNHFDVLGIPKASNEAQVKEAYFKLARRFHPDTHHDPALADMRDKIEAIFIRLGEAYEVLRNPKTRGNYEADLASRLPRIAPGTVLVSPSAPAEPEPPPDPAYQARVAEESFRKAEKLYAQEKFWDAIQLLEPAVEGAEGRMKQRIRVLLAKSYLKNPKWTKRAEEQLQVVIHEDPKFVEARMVLGALYKTTGLKNRALHEFQRVLELKPEHEEAAAEVIELTPELPEPEPEKKGGILKKLFNKKS